MVPREVHFEFSLRVAVQLQLPQVHPQLTGAAPWRHLLDVPTPKLELLRDPQLSQRLPEPLPTRERVVERPKPRVLVQQHRDRLRPKERLKEHVPPVARVAKPAVEGEPPVLPFERREPRPLLRRVGLLQWVQLQPEGD